MQYLRHFNGLDYPIKVPFLKYKLNKQHIADRSDKWRKMINTMEINSGKP